MIEASTSSNIIATLPNRGTVLPNTERLTEGDTVYDWEYCARKDLPLSVVAVHWGQIVPTDLRLGEGDGLRIFDRLYWTNPSLTYEQAVRQEIEVALSLGRRVLGLLDFDPAEVSHLTFGSGTPINPQIHFELAKALGLEKVVADPDRNITVSFSACNGGCDALVRGYTKTQTKGEPVLSIALEGLTRIIGPKRLKTDSLSEVTFSNGAAAFFGIPDTSFTCLTNTFISEVDVKGALKAVDPYVVIMDLNNPSIVQTVMHYGEVTSVRMPEPSAGFGIEMNGPDVAKFFLRFLNKVLLKAMEDYAKLRAEHPEFGLPAQPKFIVPHHASPAVVGGIERVSNRLGLEGEMPWLVTEGNSSAATTMIAFGRLIPRLEQGDVVMLISFGAGATATVSYIKIGPLQ